MSSQRTYDVVVLGATGFTGVLIAEYLAENAPSNAKWAIAGRSKSKLQDVQNRLLTLGSHKKVDIIVADSSDQESMDALVKQTKVVATTVGPFNKYGWKLIDACVRLGTHYVDLTGESPFEKKVIEKYHEQAKKNNVLIVHSSGFDSIPSDIGTLLITDYFKQRGLKTASVEATVTALSGGISGGTIASGVEMIESNPLAEIRYLNSNGDYLVPLSFTPLEDRGMFWSEKFQSWQYRFLMSTVNSRNVRRSNYLLGYGSQFSYYESKRAKNWFVAFIATAVGTIATLFMLFSLGRTIITRLIPAGTGPDEKTRKNGYFTLRFVGESEPKPDGSVETVRAVVKGIQDPGYNETAKMIAESALCLAFDQDKLKKTPGGFELVKGGVVTPASAMGLQIAKRLRDVGMTFAIEN